MTVIAIPPLSVALPEMRDGLNLLVIGTVFASFLIPAAVLLFFFTPVTIWRTPLFILNVLAIILGIIQQILYIYVIINTTVITAVPSSMVIAIVAFDFLVPVCVQGILIVRLVGVYPPLQNSRKVNIAIYVPVVAFKIARLVNAVYGTRSLVTRTPDSLSVITAAQIVWGTKYVKVEWFLQLFDDMFVSGLFVYRLYHGAIKDRKTFDTSHSGSGSAYTWAQRIRTLYYIAVSNFIFPIIFNIAEIAVIFYDPNFFHGAMVVAVNCYVTIIGVLLATIWAQGSKRGKPPSGSRVARGGGGGGRHATTAVSSLHFAAREMPAANQGDSLISGSEGSLDDESESTGSIRGEKKGVLNSGLGFQSGRGSTTRGTVDDEGLGLGFAAEKRPSESTSGGGEEATRPSRPSLCGSEPEVRAAVTTGGGEEEKRSRPPSPRTSVRSPESRYSDEGEDRISYAV